MKKKILILGISSFGGASFANYLLKKTNFKIFGTFNNKKKLPFDLFLKKNKRYKFLKLFKLDLTKNNNNLENLTKKISPNYIIDFASICMVNESWIHPKHYFQINFFSKINFIKNLYQQKKLVKYIYIGTPEIFGSNNKPVAEYSKLYNPSTPYASSKLSLEMFLNSFIQNPIYKIIIARFSNFYGRGQPIHRLIPRLVYCINKKKKFPLHGSGETKRNFIFEDDFNCGLKKVITNGKIGSKYHFSGEKYYTIKDIIKNVLHIKKYSWDKLIDQKIERKGKDKNYYLDCAKTKRELGWKSRIDIKNGIKKTVKYYDSIINEVNKKDINFKIKK
jgi:dTDP-glucose 4,6-dehydratase